MSRTTQTVTVQLLAGMRVPTRTFPERCRTGDRVIKAKSEHWGEHCGGREKETNLWKEEDKIQSKEKQMGKKSIRGGGNEAVSLFNEFGLKSG